MVTELGPRYVYIFEHGRDTYTGQGFVYIVDWKLALSPVCEKQLSTMSYHQCICAPERLYTLVIWKWEVQRHLLKVGVTKHVHHGLWRTLSEQPNLVGHFYTYLLVYICKYCTYQCPPGVGG